MIQFIGILISLVASIVSYAREKQLIEAGQAQEALTSLRSAHDALLKAREARSAAVGVDQLQLFAKDKYSRE